MAIPILQYTSHELRVYTEQEYPFHRDPYASGPNRFSAVVFIDTVPAGRAASPVKTCRNRR